MDQRPVQLGHVLVTGGCGFLGSHIVRRCLAEPGAVVFSISRNPRKLDARAKYRAVDITDETKLRALFNEIKPRVVIHTVSPSPTAKEGVLRRTVVDGTNNLLRCAADCPETRAFVYTSSDSAVATSSSPSTQLREADAQLYDEMNFNNPYGRSKALADAAVLAADSANLRTATLRLPAIYGEGDTNFIPQLLASVRKGQHRTQLGDNRKMFEFVYVGSASEAHVLAAKALLRADLVGSDRGSHKVHGEAFFITDGQPRYFFDFSREAYAAAGHPVAPDEIKQMPLGMVQAMASMGEWLYWVCTLGRLAPQLRRQNIDHLNKGCHWSIEKAQQRLGYQPVLDQHVAIQRSMKWALDNQGSETVEQVEPGRLSRIVPSTEGTGTLGFNVRTDSGTGIREGGNGR
jgi:sterol-4alpha-carboxylate 3-dehydrogenase (decarboxylating)